MRVRRAAARNPTAFELVWKNVWVRAAVQLVLFVLLLWTLIRFRSSYAFALQTALIGFVIAFPVGLLIGHTGRGAFLAINAGNAGRSLPTLAA